MQSTLFASLILMAICAVATMSVQISGAIEPARLRNQTELRFTRSNPAVDSLRPGRNNAADTKSAVGDKRINEFGIRLSITGPVIVHSWQPRILVQRSDVQFNPNVARPAYPKLHPKVLFDEAHNNADTSSGRYKPFADLLTSDGYSVVPNKGSFSKKALVGTKVVVVVNASGPLGQRDQSPFSTNEYDAVRAWVRGGGALLLITDHAPYSNAVFDLVKQFGVEITNGYSIDGLHHNPESDDESELLFDRERGLADHQITNGRDSSERINRVVTFSGTSLKGPAGSVAFLKLSDTARDVLPPPPGESKSPNGAAADHITVTAAGRAQGLALEFGKGRVVILSEAAMLTAQVTPRGLRFGMNASGTDNRQLALNIMHWLSRLQR